MIQLLKGLTTEWWAESVVMQDYKSNPFPQIMLIRHA